MDLRRAIEITLTDPANAPAAMQFASQRIGQPNAAAELIAACSVPQLASTSLVFLKKIVDQHWLQHDTRVNRYSLTSEEKELIASFLLQTVSTSTDLRIVSICSNIAGSVSALSDNWPQLSATILTLLTTPATTLQGLMLFDSVHDNIPEADFFDLAQKVAPIFLSYLTPDTAVSHPAHACVAGSCVAGLLRIASIFHMHLADHLRANAEVLIRRTLEAAVAATMVLISATESVADDDLRNKREAQRATLAAMYIVDTILDALTLVRGGLTVVSEALSAAQIVQAVISTWTTGARLIRVGMPTGIMADVEALRSDRPIEPLSLIVGSFVFTETLASNDDAMDNGLWPACVARLRDIVVMHITFLQITPSKEEMWRENPTDFINGADGDVFNTDARCAALGSLDTLCQRFIEDDECRAAMTACISAALIEAVNARASGDSHWWRRVEAALMAIQCVVDAAKSVLDMESLHELPADLTSFLQTFGAEVLSPLTSEAAGSEATLRGEADAPIPDLLLCRILKIAASIAPIITDASAYLQLAVSCTGENNSPLLRIAAAHALQDFTRTCDPAYIAQFVHQIIASLRSLIEFPEAELNELVLETLSHIFDRSDSGAINDPAVVSFVAECVVYIYASRQDDEMFVLESLGTLIRAAVETRPAATAALRSQCWMQVAGRMISEGAAIDDATLALGVDLLITLAGCGGARTERGVIDQSGPGLALPFTDPAQVDAAAAVIELCSGRNDGSLAAAVAELANFMVASTAAVAPAAGTDNVRARLGERFTRAAVGVVGFLDKAGAVGQSCDLRRSADAIVNLATDLMIGGVGESAQIFAQVINYTAATYQYAGSPLRYTEAFVAFVSRILVAPAVGPEVFCRLATSTDCRERLFAFEYHDEKSRMRNVLASTLAPSVPGSPFATPLGAIMGMYTSCFWSSMGLYTVGAASVAVAAVAAGVTRGCTACQTLASQTVFVFPAGAPVLGVDSKPTNEVLSLSAGATIYSRSVRLSLRKPELFVRVFTPGTFAQLASEVQTAFAATLVEKDRRQEDRDDLIDYTEFDCLDALGDYDSEAMSTVDAPTLWTRARIHAPWIKSHAKIVLGK